MYSAINYKAIAAIEELQKYNCILDDADINILINCNMNKKYKCTCFNKSYVLHFYTNV